MSTAAAHVNSVGSIAVLVLIVWGLVCLAYVADLIWRAMRSEMGNRMTPKQRTHAEVELANLWAMHPELRNQDLQLRKVHGVEDLIENLSVINEALMWQGGFDPRSVRTGREH